MLWHGIATRIWIRLGIEILTLGVQLVACSRSDRCDTSLQQLLSEHIPSVVRGDLREARKVDIPLGGEVAIFAVS